MTAPDTLSAPAGSAGALSPATREHVLDRVATALDRHLSMASAWYPHEYVPWELGRPAAEPWSPEQSSLPRAVRAAVQLNLLTEDNLPAYHRELSHSFAAEQWQVWLDRWTAEEGRHAMVLRDYLLVTRSVDPVLLEDERMLTVSTGYQSGGKDVLRTLAYVSLQELATRIAHRSTGRAAGDPALERLLARVSADENLHMLFYRDLVHAALEVDPGAMLPALAAEVESFQMPGAVSPDFARRAVLVARAGIYNLQVFRDDVLAPLLRYWGVFELTGLPPRAEAARDRIAASCSALDARVRQLEEQAAARAG